MSLLWGLCMYYSDTWDPWGTIKNRHVSPGRGHAWTLPRRRRWRWRPPTLGDDRPRRRMGCGSVINTVPNDHVNGKILHSGSIKYIACICIICICVIKKSLPYPRPKAESI